MSGYESAGELRGNAWKRLTSRTKSAASAEDHMGMELAPAPQRQPVNSGRRNPELRAAFVKESEDMKQLQDIKTPVFAPGSNMGSTRNDPTGWRRKLLGLPAAATKRRNTRVKPTRGRSVANSAKQSSRQLQTRGRRGRGATKKRS